MAIIKRFEDYDMGRFSEDEDKEWMNNVEEQDIEDDETIEDDSDQDYDEIEDEESEEEEEEARRRIWGDEVVEKSISKWKSFKNNI